jgi:ADP-ribosylglycohydrolase
MPTLREKITGMFMGVAVGDALGMPFETMTAEEIEARYGQVAGYLPPPQNHKWHKSLKQGMGTDDTQLTLAAAEGLMLGNGFFMPDIAKAHVKALGESVSGWGRSTKEAVKRLKRGMSWQEAAMKGPGYGEGNGVIMKIAPLAAYLFLNPSENQDEDFQRILDFTRMTHDTSIAVSASLAHVAVICYCLRSDPVQFNVEEYLRRAIAAASSGCVTSSFAEKLLRVCKTPAHGRLKILKEIHSSPFNLLHSAPLSHAAFLDSPTNFDCVCNAVAAGGDTDTNASIVGGLFGALNGIHAISVEFISGLHDNEKVLEVANRFCDAFLGKKE